MTWLWALLQFRLAAFALFKGQSNMIRPAPLKLPGALLALKFLAVRLILIVSHFASVGARPLSLPWQSAELQAQCNYTYDTRMITDHGSDCVPRRYVQG